MNFKSRRKSGVTLAEALIMIMVAGSLIVPVIGTLQQGIQRTGHYEVRSALQNFAESKMAEITYQNMYQGVAPANEVAEMKYPNATDTEFIFKLQVEVLANPDLVDDNSVLTGKLHPALCAVSITASLSQSFVDTIDEVEPVHLVTMLCPPPPPPDYVYTAHPSTNKIGVINPMIPDLITEISVAPYYPMQLAIHPNGRYVAVKCRHQVLMLDPVTGNYTQILNLLDLCANTLAETGEGNNNARLDRGLVFRPDGKFLYLTRHNSKSVIVLESPSDPTQYWTSVATFTTTSDMANDMKMLDDGTLVVAEGNATNNKILRINTHTNTLIDTWAGGADTSTSPTLQLAMAGEWGGNNVYARLGNKRLTKFSTHSPTSFFVNQLGGSFTDFTDAREHSILVNYDNRWVFSAIAYNSTGASTQRLAAFKVASYSVDLTTTTNSKLVERGNTGGDSARPISQIEFSPYREQLILKTTDSKLMFPGISSLIAGSYALINDIPAVLTLSSPIADVKGRLAEYVWVAASNGASHTLNCIDLYGGNDGKGAVLEDDVISVSFAPRGIGLNASGIHGAFTVASTGLRPQKLNVSDHSAIQFPNTLNFPSTGRAKHCTYLLDGSLLVLSEKVDCNCHQTGDYYPGMGLNWSDMHNGFLLYEVDANGNPAATPCLGFNARSDSSAFRVRDVAPMHRKSGAYVLMSREDQTDSLLLWIEKSRAAGYTPQQTGETYRIMGYWRGLFDGFPSRSAVAMALSADDTMLALYDNYGNGANQTISFYDLTNNHFPTTAGLAYNRYKDGSVSSPLNAAVPNTFYDAQLNSNWPSYTVDRLKPGNILTASTTLDADSNFNSRYPVDFNWDVGNFEDVYMSLTGYFYHDTAAAFTGLKSHDASRFAKGGYFPYRNSATRVEWRDESTTDCYASYNYLTGPGSGSVQFDLFNDDSGVGANFGFSTSAANFSSGSWGSVASMPAQMFRPFKFKPFLIKEMVLNGLSVTDYAYPSLPTSATRDVLMCFNRDSAIPALFYFDRVNKRLYAYSPFSEQLKLYNTSNSTTNKFYVDISPMGLTAVNDMTVSPDGRRLLVAATDSSNGMVLLLDIAYHPGTPGLIRVPAIDHTIFKKLSLAEPALMLATRPFNSFNSFSGSATYSYPTTTPTGATLVSGYGSHRAAVADGGIHVFGGAPGIEEEPNNDRVYRIKSDANVDLITVSSMTNKLKDFAAVPFDDNKILLFGGEAPADSPQSSVSVYDAKSQKFVQDAYEAMRPDDNSEKNKLRRHAAASTPFGPVIIGGIKGDVSSSDIQIAIDAGWSSPANQQNSCAGVSSGYLTLGTGGGDFGSVFLNQSYMINDGTSFLASFTTTMFKKDGITFCVQNDAANRGAIGGSNAGLGYDGIANSLAVWIDTKGDNDGPSGASSTDDFVAITSGGNRPSDAYSFSSTDHYKVYSSGGLGSTSIVTKYWWVVYDGQRNKINVWCGSSNDPESADWAVKDFTADLPTLVGGLGSSAYFGFTGACNDGTPGYIKVKDFSLKIWEKEAYGTHTFDHASFPSIPADFNKNGSIGWPKINSNRIEFSDSSSERLGSVWWSSALDLNSIASFKTRFAIKMHTGGSAGMAFVVQGMNNNPTNTGGGGHLGYAGINNSFAVEFDTYDVLSYDPDSSGVGTGGESHPAGNHVSIVKNGAATTAGSHKGNLIPYWDMNANSSLVNWVWVEYDNPTNNLRVYMTKVSDTSEPAQPATASINHIFNTDLKTLCGGTGQAWIGFTARSGSPSQVHELAAWNYQKSSQTATVGGLTNEVKTYLPNTISGYMGEVTPLLHTVTNASIVSDGLQLVPAVNYNVGAVWLESAIPITNTTSFSTHYVVSMPGAGTPDGTVFVLQAIGNTAIGGNSDNVGYQGIGQSIGIELDGYDSPSVSGWDDPSGNHISLLANGNSKASLQNYDLDLTSIDVSDTKDKHVWVDFDGSTLNLKAYVSTSHIKPATPYINHTFGSGMATALGGSPNAFFGFTAATGGLNRLQKVTHWELIVDNKQIIRFPPRGETLASTDLPANMINGTAVTHYSRKDGKYYLYLIGPGPAIADQFENLVYKFDFDSGVWTPIQLWHASNKINLNFAMPNSASIVNKASQVAACSWGDEIFIFGGSYFNSGLSANRTHAMAFNPDTMTYRELAPLPAPYNVNGLISASAVPYGPFIYLIGGSTAPTGTSGATNAILRYKP